MQFDGQYFHERLYLTRMVMFQGHCVKLWNELTLSLVELKA